jgi:aminopeptidase N
LPGLSGDMTRGMREFVTAHEVAHQWWHVLVGSDSRLHPFADEGLAQYSTLLYFEDRYGKERAEREAEQNLTLPYQMMRLAGQSDAPVERPVASFASPVAYAGLVYGKGPFFYREARRLLGDEQFFSRLMQYRERFAFRVAPGRAVIDALAGAQSGAQSGAIALLARRWLDEAHGDEDLGKLDAAELLRSLAPGVANSAAPPAIPDELRRMLNGAGL